MSHLYLDSSAIAKRYLSEIGSAWLATFIDPATGNTIIVAEITQVEVAAAFAARHRAGSISLSERNDAVDLLARHCEDEYELVATTRHILDLAVNLTQRHRLRGYDAIQLATALATNDALAAAGQPGLTFIAADSDLVAAGVAEGLTGDNPILHR